MALRLVALAAMVLVMTLSVIDADGPDDEFECNMRRVAHAHAQRIISSPTQRDSVATALQLGRYCNQGSTGVPIIPTPLGPAFRHNYISQPDGGPTVWISPNGHDVSGDGSQKNPFATPIKARNVLRSRNTSLPATIAISPGSYYLNETLSLGPADKNLHWMRNTVSHDNGTANKASASDDAIFSGGIQIGPLLSDWHRWDGAPPGLFVLTATVAEGALPSNTIPSLFINGVQHWQARYPNGDPNSGPNYPPHESRHPSQDTLIPTSWEKSVVPPDGNHFPNTPSGVDHKIAWPNVTRNWTSTGTRDGIYTWTEGGPANERFDPPASYWASTVPTGMFVNATHTARWLNGSSKVTHATLHTNQWPASWGGTWMFDVAAVNSSGAVSFGGGGHQEARGSHGSPHFLWYIENLLVELDQPGEYYYDPVNRTLYVAPNITGEPETLEDIIIPSLASVVSIENTSGVVLSGITVKHTRPTFKTKYESLPGGDWAIYRGAALFVQDSSNVTIQNCTLDRLGGNGIFFSNNVTSSVVAGNELVRIGDTGIALVGSTFYGDGTRLTHPRNNLITLNHIHEVGIIGKGQAAYFQAMATKNTISRNVMYNGPRTGVECNDGFGGGWSIAENLLFHFSRETGGHSAFNAWDREPFLTLHENGSTSVYPEWNTVERNIIISYNMWAESPNNDWCIDFDDGASFYLTRDNVCVYGNIKTHGSGAKYLYRNMLLYPDVPADGHACITAQSRFEGSVYIFNNTCQLVGDGPVLDQPGCNKSNLLQTMPTLSHNNYKINGQDPVDGCAPLSVLQAVGVENGSSVEPWMNTTTIVSQSCMTMQATDCPEIFVPVAPPTPPLPPTPCRISVSGYNCTQGACAEGPSSNMEDEVQRCKPSLSPDAKHECKYDDWTCAVNAAKDACENRPECVSFALSDVNSVWGLIKLYAQTAHPVKNSQWNLWSQGNQ